MSYDHPARRRGVATSVAAYGGGSGGLWPGKRTLTGTMYRRARSQSAPATDPEAAVAGGVDSAAVALPAALRTRFEAASGTDLSGVRLHVGGEADRAATAVSADAFALGPDICFASGMYAPGTGEGDRLIAHEVAHTLQQGAGAAVRTSGLETSEPGDAHEEAADRAADVLLSGSRSGAPLQVAPSPPLIARQVRGHREHVQLGTVTVDFWVSEDGLAQSPRRQRPAEAATPAQVQRLRDAWQRIVANSGQLHINETEPDYGAPRERLIQPTPQEQREFARSYEHPGTTAHPGFRQQIEAALAQLLTQPSGRQLVIDLVFGPHLVVVRPPSAGDPAHRGHPGQGVTRYVDEVAARTPGDGSGSTITLDPDEIRRVDPAVYGDARMEHVIANPLFVILGHELVHARHLEAGMNRALECPHDIIDYNSREEEVTIVGDPAHADEPSENSIRAEHHLPARVGITGTQRMPGGYYFPNLPDGRPMAPAACVPPPTDSTP